MSLLWGLSPLWANILHCLSTALVYNHTLYSTGSCFLYEDSAEAITRSLSARAFELSSLSESKRNLAQHDNARGATERNRQWSPQVSGVVSHRFNLSRRPTYLISTDAWDEELINFYCDICRRGKCGNKTEKKKFSCSSSQALCLCQNSIDFSADFIDSLEYC